MVYPTLGRNAGQHVRNRQSGWIPVKHARNITSPDRRLHTICIRSNPIPCLP
jgi:hypothetical protein